MGVADYSLRELAPERQRESRVTALLEVRGPAGLVQRRAAEVMAQLQPVRCGLPANDVQPLELPARRSA